MQGHSAPPATSMTHQLVAQPRKVREGCVTTVFSHRMISRSWSTENGVSPPLAVTRRVRVLGSLEDMAVGAMAMGAGVGLGLAMNVDWKEAEACGGEERWSVCARGGA